MGTEPRIKLDNFQGPHEFLLQLVRSDELPVCDVALAEVVRQYLDYLSSREEVDLEESGRFVVSAATLLQMKSRFLLPDEEEEPEEELEEEISEEFIRQLLEYRRFQGVVEDFRAREVEYSRLYSREDDEVLTSARVTLNIQVDVGRLQELFDKAIERAKSRQLYRLAEEEVTVEEKTQELRDLLRRRGRLNLNRYFDRQFRVVAIIAAFLAILEMVRLAEIRVFQKDAYGDIVIALTEPSGAETAGGSDDDG